MRLRALTTVLVLLATALSCSRDPEVVKRKYLQSGNRYFEKGQYKEASIMYRQALRKDPRYGEAYYRLGLTHVKLGRLLDAIRSLRRAVELLPGSTEPRIQLADLYLGALLLTDRANTRQVETLRTELSGLADQLLKKDPNSVPGLRYSGYCALTENRLKEAIARFRAANEISPLQPDVVLPLAQSLIADKQVEEAEKLCKTLLAKEKTFGPIYDVLYVQYLRTNRMKEAEEILKAKVENNPKRAEYLIQLAGYYYGTGRRPEMLAALDKLTSNLKDFPSAHQLVGDFYLRRSGFDSAISQYEQGARNEPKQKALYEKKKAQALIAQGKRTEAVRLLEELLKQDANDVEAQAMRASLLIETGSREEVQTAVTELQAMVGRMPENPVLRYNLGRALIRKGETEQARSQFQEAIRRQAGYLPPRLALAEIHLARQEYPMALQVAKQVLEVDPRNLPAKLVRTNALLGMGNLAQARIDATATLREHPNSREAVLQVALLDLAEKKFKDAEQTFLKLHQSAPADLRGLMGLTETYAAQNQYDKAIRLIREELDKDPERAQLRLALANLAVRSKQYDLAISEYQRLVEKDPNDGGYYLRLGEAQRLKGDFKAAAESFRKATVLMPNQPYAHLPLALLLDTLGQREEARVIYEKLLRLQPDNPVALNNLAYMTAETGGDLDEALTLAQRAKQKLPQDPNVADTLGWIYIKKNLSDNAIEIFRDLVRRQPDNCTYRYHLAMALFQKGDKPQARKELQAALQKKPSPEELNKIKDLMAKVS